MRWIPDRCKFNAGDLRTKRKFLLFPKTLQCETRWWESVDIIQEWCVYSGYYEPCDRWEDKRWADREM